MTASRSAKSISQSILRFLLGPWPFFPWIVFGALLLLIVVQNLQLSLLGAVGACRYSCVTLPANVIPLINQERVDLDLNDVDLILVFGNALGTAVMVGLVLWLGGYVARRRAVSSLARMPYVVVILVASILGGLARVLFLSPILNAAPTLTAVSVLPTSVRTFVSITIVQSLCGMLTARYQRQVDAANEAMSLVRAQQRLVVEADERAKRQVAELLHDRVQAELLVVAMEIRASIEECGELEARARLQRAVDDLERVRTTDVRSASRRLSPAFGTVGLDTALDELAESWSPVLRARIAFDAASRALLMAPNAPRSLVTGIYRITEQALLNAVSHGEAARVEVSLTMPDAHALRLTITDDGKGLGSMPVIRGSGSAIIDAWCETTDGNWSLNSGAVIGAIVHAEFAAPQSPER